MRLEFMGIWGSAKHLPSSKGYYSGREEREPVLTSRDVSFLVVVKLCDQAGG